MWKSPGSCPAGITIQEIRADYKKAALLGDVIVPRVACGEDKCYTVVLGERNRGDLHGCLAESRGVAFTGIFIEGTEPKQAAVRPYR